VRFPEKLNDGGWVFRRIVTINVLVDDAQRQSHFAKLGGRFKNRQEMALWAIANKMVAHAALRGHNRITL